MVRGVGKYYPIVEIESGVDAAAASPERLRITFLLDAHSALRTCETLNGNFARIALSKCPDCTVRQLQCAESLSLDQLAAKSDLPVAVPTAHMALGTMVFSAGNASMALDACRATEQQTSGEPQPVKCYAPGTPRPKPTLQISSNNRLGLSLAAATLAALITWLVCWLIVRYEHLHSHLSHDPADRGPQKFHAHPTPRVGGIGLFAGLIAAGGLFLLWEGAPGDYDRDFGLLLFAAAPAFLGGLIEDVTKRVGVLERLLLTMISGAVGAWLIGAVLDRLELPGIGEFPLWLPFGVAFTAFAVGGLANAMNIVDGYNGLAAGYGIIVLLAIAALAGQLGDNLVFVVALAMAGALMGFLHWNWPRGRIFLGDGGAYLLGFVLAELSILLIARHQSVSTWFPLLLLAYPVFETMFSIYRKKFVRGVSPGKPDGLHLHMLIFKRVVPLELAERRPLSVLEKNSRVAKYVWLPSAMLALIAYWRWQNTTALIMATCIYCMLYVIAYTNIVRWKARRLCPWRRG